LLLTPGTAGAIPGTLVLMYQTVTYQFADSKDVPGRVTLWRMVEGSAQEELIAPFGDDARFRFFVNNQPDAQDAAPVLAALSDEKDLAYLHRQASLEDVFLKLTGRDLRD
jgi:hypothetical protein